MPNNKHIYLRNPVNTNDGFKKTRGFKPPEIEEEDIRPKVIEGFQKEKLRSSNIRFYSLRKQRKEAKSLIKAVDIDLIRIHFFCVFNLDLQKKFLLYYGLSVLDYNNFNKTVLFELTDESQFQVFIDHIRLVTESEENESYEGKEYNLIALINDFEFLNDRARLGTITNRGSLLCLISSVNSNSKFQKDELVNFLSEGGYNPITSEQVPDLIEIANLPTEVIHLVAKNFDIVRLITSSRSVRLRPGIYGELRRDFGFDVTVPDNLPIIGVIDTGLSLIDPLRPLFSGIAYDQTTYGIHFDEIGHGTMVAGLIVFGDEFNKDVKTTYQAKAKIAVIKALHFEDDDINILLLLDNIRRAKREYGIRVFNMSLNIPVVKKYNESHSSFAYELDKLAFEEDILIIMSVGNFDPDELNRLLQTDTHPTHEYPSFFYDPSGRSPHHNCWSTNILEPSESFNNLSVGALAGNLEPGDNSDLTPLSDYPAYYSRKFHYDYNQTINGTQFKRSQNNKHLNKPDVVYEGGDLKNYNSGVEILRSPLSASEKFYGRASGTSISTPLVTSIAADILKVYPTLRTQTVKALIINAGSKTCGPNPPDFRGFPNLLQKLVGQGKPLKNNVIFSDDNTVIFIIEDKIDVDEVKVIPLNLPEYIIASGNKLRFEMTLTYSFLPVKDNHLNYLPLYISFGLFRPFGAEIIGHKNSKTSEYQIKSSISWSEDFFGVENRLFSNSQKVSFNLQPNDVSAINSSVSIAVRCTCKKEIPVNYLDYLNNTSHQFSLAIAISEIPEVRATGQLYNAITAINTIENIAENTAELDL